MHVNGLKQRILATAAAGAVALGLSAGTANAAIAVDNWTFDFSGGAFAGLTIDTSGIVTGIEEAAFLLIGRTVATGLAPGNTFTVDSAGRFQALTGSTISGQNQLNLVPGSLGVGSPGGFEVTFEFTADGVFTSNDGTNAGFSLTSATLNFFVDDMYVNATTPFDTTGGTPSTATDGVAFATFELLVGAGNLNIPNADGNVDTTLRLVSALPGVILDEDGNDLSLLVDDDGDPVLLAITDGNFDTDIGGSGNFQYNPSGFDCGLTQTDFCFREDGSLTLALLPEPASLGIMGIGLVGISLMARRRRTSTKAA